MILKLYKVNDGQNVINKELYSPAVFDIQVRADFNIINPTLLLNNEMGFDIRLYNYCSIDDLNRKYFINNVVAVNNGFYRLECECDVLETYKNAILGSTARFLRNIRTGDYFDAQISTSINKSVTTFASDMGLEGEPTMIMTTIGG